MNDTNPYAAPEYVEEDVPYDLRKIVRRYIRFAVAWKWFILLVFIEILAVFVCTGIIGLVEYSGLLRSPEVRNTIEILFACLIIPAYLVLIILWYYGTFATLLLAFALKYRLPAMLLMILGAIYFPFMILVVILVRSRAKHILRTTGVENINGKMYLTEIPVEEDD